MNKDISTFDVKIDLFMKRHVISAFDPRDIFWWFSVSGGKDSYSMVRGIHRWYEKRGINAESVVFHINQWNPKIIDKIKEQFRDYKCKIIDGFKETKYQINYKYGEQAPCRKCSDVRRKLNDELIFKESINNKKINLLCKGLHLSDMAVSLLWRFIVNRNPFIDILGSNKGSPVTKLRDNIYLAKPLSYVREYETQLYSNSLDFQPVCCGCPACNFPSRRDIVEETILQFNRSPLWEFKIPGINSLLNHWCDEGFFELVKNCSCPGVETKINHLPKDLGEFAKEYFTKQLIGKLSTSDEKLFDYSTTLESIGNCRLKEFTELKRVKKIPFPTFLNSDECIDDELSSLMLATLGPFWGAIGLTPTLSREAFRLQNKYFHFKIDKNWNQTTKVLIEYYRRNNVYKPQSKRTSVLDFNNSSTCICNNRILFDL